MLLIVWSGAIVGVLFRVLWTGAPRWLYVPAYAMLGWVAVFYFGPLLEHAGGRGHDVGRRRWGALQPRRDRLRDQAPDFSPRWFGFHEVFHALTILAFTAHFVAASLALTGPSAA